MDVSLDTLAEMRCAYETGIEDNQELSQDRIQPTSRMHIQGSRDICTTVLHFLAGHPMSFSDQ